MRELEKIIEGKGDVKGKLLKQLFSSEVCYLYECTGENFYPHYEVFRRRENTQYDMVSYPRSNNFGKWAWTFSKFEDAKAKFDQITEEGENGE